MLTVAETLSRLVAEAARGAGFPAEAIEPCVPAGQGHGADYQSNAAFRLAKAARLAPRAVAERLAAQLPESDALAAVSVAGPGFLNLRLREDFLARQVEDRRADPHFGSPQTGRDRTVVIDYSSPNVAKRMHIAHLRSTVIGNALDRMHRWLGWRVIADNHLGDWGTPFGKLIVAWRGWRDDAAFQADAIGELQRLYQSFKDRAAERPELEDQARAETAKLQAGDPENRALWSEFVRVSLAEFEKVYQRLGVRFDVTLGESFYQEELAPLVQELLDREIAVEDDGAVVVWADSAEKGGGKGPLVIRKRDGAALYGTTDLATVRYRLRTWAPDLILYVTDLRQQEHFRQVFATCRRWGHTTELRHVPFGILRFPSGAIAATRTGEVQNLVDVLDAAVARARGVLAERSGQLSEEEQAKIAEAMGVAAVRYFDLSQNPASDITFDMEKSLSLEANSAPYLLYGYARCQSLLRRGGEEGPLLLQAAEERELALALVRLPEVVQLAATTCRPNLLCDHLYAIVQSYSRFWEQCRVYGDGIPAEVSGSRLRLVAATAKALEQGFGCLGLPTVDRL